MKRRTLAFVSILFLLASSPVLADTGKNLLLVVYRNLPEDAESLLTTDPGSWDFNFRPYGSSADDLWIDPGIQRKVIAGGQSEKRLTAISVSCNERGFTLLVFCAEPDIAGTIAKTNSLPSPSLEFYFTPGDADTPKIEHYYQMYYENGTLEEFPWLEQDRHFRPCLPYTTHDEKILPNGFLVRFNVAWDPLFDRLPLDSEKIDNFWRLSVIRWADRGLTWGGVVHQVNQAGYIRWPAFTQKQKTAIREHLLCRAWTHFRLLSSKPSLTTEKGWGGVALNKAPYRLDEMKEDPCSFLNCNEDPDFRPILEQLTAERNALGPEIARFSQMTPEEQKAFYDKASDMLFNFAYDVEAAYRAFATKRLFNEK